MERGQAADERFPEHLLLRAAQAPVERTAQLAEHHRVAALVAPMQIGSDPVHRLDFLGCGEHR
ncbi:hypothetical protein NSK11_contig00271-0003 [Nocardia seriolae]|uniref:Uncharacterized protein n=1 Tax=Nocardia seriolae TaxID=37332 RepID=A0ABC9Z820_9NOCA|nr:hypothetical protein [Nocardia seriolae]WNJ60688.1 hypothetical protein RMO66_08190 [Nocardia seriolae]GAM51467.1 hypothetical protein NS07_v2contig00268-0003 [Nocardia seriolae]GAP33450.1 hypothetical protein NSK11_contig00271-0003 [Nocardia seriolae]